MNTVFAFPMYCTMSSEHIPLVILYTAPRGICLFVGVWQHAPGLPGRLFSREYLVPLPANEEADLISLWARRGDLKSPEWDRLWTYVSKVLAKCHPAVLRDLPDSREDYINGFWLDKVQQDKFGNTRLESAKALATFFKNYLIDVQRSQIRRPITYMDDEALVDHLAEGDDESLLLDIVSTKDDPAEHAYWNQLLQLAATFIVGLCKEDQIYLSLQFCDVDSDALYIVAAQYEIPSHHYRAGQLGITHAKQHLPAKYAATRIGEWIDKKLRLSITKESSPQVLEAFRALCVAALAYRKELLARLSNA